MYSLLACKFSAEKSAYIFMEIPLNMILFLLLLLEIILYFYLLLFFMMICLSVCLSWFILHGTLCTSCTWISVCFFFSGSGNFQSLFYQTHYQYFSLSLFSFWDPYNVNVSMFDIVQMSFKLSSFFKFVFLFSVLTW